MLKIRLSMGGVRKRPIYKIVIADSRAPRDGRFIEKIGSFNPLLPKDKKERISVEAERVKYWMSKGAKPTLRVSRILGEAQIMPMPKVGNNPLKAVPKKDRKKADDKEVPKAEAPKAEAPKAEAPKAEAPKAEAPKAEAPKVEEKKEEPKTEAPKVEEKKAEAPKVEEKKVEAPKVEEKKESVNQDSQSSSSLLGYFSKREYDKALAAYDECLRLKPRVVPYLGNRAAVLLKLANENKYGADKSKLKQVIGDCELAVDIDPKYTRGWVRLGQAYFTLGDDPQKEDSYDVQFLKNAEEAFEKVLELDPDNKIAKKTVDDVRMSIQLYED